MDVGVEKLITNQRKFEQALSCGACFCCKAEAYISFSNNIFMYFSFIELNY